MNGQAKNGRANNDLLLACTKKERSRLVEDSLLSALTSADQQADLAVSRTRRRVYSTMVDMRAQKVGRRKQTGLILMVSFLFLLLLAPAIWCSVEIFRNGGHFVDMQMQAYLLALMLFPALVAAATAGYLRHHRGGDQHEL